MPWRAPAAALAIVLGLSALTVSAVFANQPPTVSTTIAAVQGTGDTTPLAGQRVTVRGIVTADLRGADSYDSLYLQAESSADLVGASDGILVNLAGTEPEVTSGDLVEVTGSAGETDGETRIVASAIDVVSAGVGLPDVTELPDDATDRESLEGMLVAPVGDYTLASLDLDATGSMQITDATGSPLTIDDGYSVTPTSRPYLPANTLFTAGSVYTAPEHPMVLGQVADGYRLEPTTPVDASTDDSYLPSFALDGFVLGEAPRMQEP